MTAQGVRTGNGRYAQPTLDGCEPENRAEIAVDNCILTSEPQYRNRRQGEEWICVVQAPPDYWHPLRDDRYVLHAAGDRARHAHQCHLRRGHRVDVRGVPRSYEVPLLGGGVRIVSRLDVSAIQPISREERWLSNRQTYEMRYHQTHSARVSPQRGLE